MKTYTKEELQNILELHLKWINNESYGIKADLREADLRGADLRGADLRGANLRWADLSGANLRKANLRGANLRWADLSGADLRGANLRWADLRGANLRGADLRGADLRKANLREAENIIYAECSFYSHGECGRKLLAIVIENEIKYFCGCFSGSEEELQEYINDGDEKYKESRQFAFDFVTKAIKMKKYE